VIGAAKAGRRSLCLKVLNPGEFSVWLGAIEKPNADPAAWLLLDERERQRALKLVEETLRTRYVHIRASVRKLLADIVGDRPAQLNIQIEAFGKPYLANYSELTFNLSHSGSYVLLGLGYRCRLGVDIEVGKKRIDLKGLVNKCFAEEEQAIWRTVPDLAKPAHFYQTWTYKEAFVKAVGRGLALGLPAVIPDLNQSGRFLHVPKNCGFASDWHSLSLTAAPYYYAALAADRTIDSLSIHPFPN
jgi:4'-phosphopantetheinyl transferase